MRWWAKKAYFSDDHIPQALIMLEKHINECISKSDDSRAATFLTANEFQNMNNIY